MKIMFTARATAPGGRSGTTRAEAQALVAAVHQICPCSNAVRGNVDVRLHVTVA